MSALKVAVPVLSLAQAMWLLVTVENEQKRVTKAGHRHIIADQVVTILDAAVRDAVGAQPR